MLHLIKHIKVIRIHCNQSIAIIDKTATNNTSRGSVAYNNIVVAFFCQLKLRSFDFRQSFPVKMYILLVYNRCTSIVIMCPTRQIESHRVS